MLIFTTLCCNAATYGGTITITVGEDYFVNASFGGGLTQTGSWTKSNSTFMFVSRSNTSCTIRGNQVGTGTLYYDGAAGAYDVNYYWTVNVVSGDNPNTGGLTLTATPAGGTVEKGTKVRLKANNESALIFYTLDGSDPKTSNTTQSIPSDYPNGPVINESCTLKAYAQYIIDSDVYTWNYTVKGNTINIDANNFPDINFRNYLLEQTYGKDGKLTEDEINGITSIEVYSKGISSLKGIEYFTALKTLRCGANQLTTLDISRNTALTNLHCSNNKLTSLDVSQNTKLTDFQCQSNQLTSLDVSKNTALTSLSCYSNQLTSLDVSKNTALTKLDCSSNQLTSLDVSKNTALTSLSCYSNQLTSLDVSKNTALTSLVCELNELTSLDVSKNTALTTLNCYNNKLTSLDVSKNTALTTLNCYINKLTSLDVSKNTALTTLNCNNNQLTSLDIPKNTALTTLNCYNNQLTSLDVSKNTALKELQCWYNKLTSLNVSGCTALTTLDCQNNQLTSLDVSGCTALKSLRCYQNQIKGESMDALINGLPQNITNENYDLYVIYYYGEGNICTKPQVAMAKAKGWIPQKYSYNAGWQEYEGSDDEPAGIADVKTSGNADAPIYTLSGQKVANVKKGIYIKNGHKVVIK